MGYIIAFIVGTTFGFFIAALVVAAEDDRDTLCKDDEEDKREIENDQDKEA